MGSSPHHIYVTQMQTDTVGLGASPQFKIFITYFGPSPRVKAVACLWASVLFIVTESLCLSKAVPTGPIPSLHGKACWPPTST